MKLVFKFLWQSIKSYRFYYLLMIIAPVIGAFYKPIVYYVIKMMVDIISSDQQLTFKHILLPLIMYIVSDVVLSTVWRLSNIASWRSEPYVQRNIILRVLYTVLSFRYNFFQNVASGSVVSKIKGLVEGYQELWAQLWYGISYWILASVISVFSIFLINYQLGLIILSWSLLFIAVNYFFAQKINALSQLASDAKHAMIGSVADNINNASSIKLFASRDYEYQRLKQQINSQFIPQDIKLIKFQTIVDILNDIVAIVFITTILIIMIKFKQMHLVTTGDFVFVFSMMFQLQENLWHFIQEFHKLSNKIGDLTSSLSLYNADQSEDATAVTMNSNVISDQQVVQQDSQGNGLIKHNGVISFHGAIEFNNIDFKYNDSKQIFQGLNLSIKAGERIGIVGYTGGGKTTLINLLLKVFTPQAGVIMVDGIDIAQIDCDLLRSQIAVIPQDIALFHRNLFDNIRYGRLEATDEEVIASSKLAHAHEFIELLPEGYNTFVGERGIKLSGGQRQRIAIARAILKNAPILILDEATSSLDSITEEYIQESIAQLLVGKTVLAVAHRLSTLKDMDRLIVIHDGQIVADDNHDNLIKQKNSLYSQIWQAQYHL